MPSEELPRARRPKPKEEPGTDGRARSLGLNPLVIAGVAFSAGLGVCGLIAIALWLQFRPGQPAAVAVAPPPARVEPAVSPPRPPAAVRPAQPVSVQPPVVPEPTPPTSKLTPSDRGRGRLDADSDPKPDPLADGQLQPDARRGAAPPPTPAKPADPAGDGFMKPPAEKADKPDAGGAKGTPGGDGFVKPKDGESAIKKDDIAALARQLRKGATPKARMDAAHKLRVLGPAAAVASKDLCDALADPSPAVVQAVIQAIEQVRPDLYQPLTKLAVDRDPNNHLTAAKELGLMGKEAECCVGILLTRLRAELSRGPDAYGKLRPMQLALFEAVRTINPDDAATIAYYKVLASPAAQFDPAKWQALDSLHKWAATDEGRRKQVLPFALAGLKNAYCLSLAIRVLGEYGPLAKEAAPELRRLKLSGSADTRQAAAEALDRVEGRGI